MNGKSLISTGVLEIDFKSISSTPADIQGAIHLPALPPSSPPRSLTCQQPIADDPYLDIELSLNPTAGLRAVALLAPPNEPHLHRFELSSGADLGALMPCTNQPQ